MPIGKWKNFDFYFGTKKGHTYPLVKISLKKDIHSVNSVFYAAMSHLAALYGLMCSRGVMISKGLLSQSMANIMSHILCDTAPIAVSRLYHMALDITGSKLNIKLIPFPC